MKWIVSQMWLNFKVVNEGYLNGNNTEVSDYAYDYDILVILIVILKGHDLHKREDY